MALRSAGGGAWDWNLDTGEIWWSPEYYELRGVQPGTATELAHSLATIHPDDRESVLVAVRETIDRGADYRCEFRIHHSALGERWIAAYGQVVRDESGRPTHLLGISLDVTERKRLAEERDAELARLQLQFERMPLAYVQFDADLRVTDWNPAAERIFGYAREEVLGMGPPFAKILPESAWPAATGILERIQAGDMAAHAVNENRTKDGRTIVCQWHNTPLLDEAGTFVGLLSLAQDITARIEAEAALRLRDRAIQAITQGIVITDPGQPDNPIVYASPSFGRLTGYAEAEVLGRNYRFLQGRDTDPEAVARLREAVGEGQPCTVELLNYRRDGTPFWNELSISPVRDDRGRLTHFVGVLTDVTQRRRLEEQYHQAQKMEAIGQLAGGVAHDFMVGTVQAAPTGLVKGRQHLSNWSKTATVIPVRFPNAPSAAATTSTWTSATSCTIPSPTLLREEPPCTPQHGPEAPAQDAEIPNRHVVM